MPRIATRNAFRLAYRQRFSMGVRMLGCLVLLAGSIVIVAAVAEAAKGASPGHIARMGALGGALVLIGGPLFCGERGKVFDRQARTMTSWLGMFRPLWRNMRDLQPYQSVKADAYVAAGAVRWRVYLSNSQGEQLELFDLAGRDAAEAAARQVGSFMSVVVAPMPTVSVEPLPGSVPGTTAIEAAAISDSCWTYRRSFAPIVRLIGLVMASLSIILLVGIALSPGKDRVRGLPVATGALLLPLGLALFFGGRRVSVDKARQTVRVWRAWPLPPDGYELETFCAVFVGCKPVNAEPTSGQPVETFSVGLVDREQQRLDLAELPASDEALALATGLAAMLQFPLIDERQTSQFPCAS